MFVSKLSKKSDKSVVRERRRLDQMKMPARAFDGSRFVVNEEGRPVAWVVPYEQMRGIMAIYDDIVNFDPTDELTGI